MSKSKVFFVSLFVILLLSGIATAEIYKWVDEKGQTHYSDHPPQDTGSKGEVKVIPNYNSSSQSGTNVEESLLLLLMVNIYTDIQKRLMKEHCWWGNRLL